MPRLLYWVLALDAVLVTALAGVYRDLIWRLGYAHSVHTACPGSGCSYSASFSFGLMTRYFTMAGNGVSLTSPPTLDWVQVVVLLLVVVNGWYAYTVVKGRSRAAAVPAATLK